LTYRCFFPENFSEWKFNVEVVPLSSIVYVAEGMHVNAHEKHSQGAFRMEDVVSDNKDKKHPKPFVEGKHLDKWLPIQNRWLEWGTDRAPSKFRRPTFPEMYNVDEKIIVQRSPGPDPKCCYDTIGLHYSESVIGFIPWGCLAGVRNRSLKKVTRYSGEKPIRYDLPKREELEDISERFSIEYLLAVMNSSFAREYLRSNRRSNIHLYSNDWKKLPIPDVPKEKQEPVVALVDQILDLKKKDPAADISELEQKLDVMVARLYGVAPGRTDAAREHE